MNLRKVRDGLFDKPTVEVKSKKNYQYQKI